MSTTFTSLGLSAELIRATKEQGYDSPTSIQQQAIPYVLKGDDVMAAAQTGTGKTASFTLPLICRLSNHKPPSGNQVHSLILAPTRELAIQVEASVKVYSKYTSLRSTVVYGGVSINPQMKYLRGGIDILVATPGRLLDLYRQNAIRFDELKILVLDEADRMLDMGFIRDIEKIIKLLPRKRQTLMFSATFSPDIRHLAQRFLNSPQELSVTPENSATPLVHQTLHPVDKSKKSGLLITLIQKNQWPQVLVFVRTRHGANRLAKNLDKNNISAAAIHGDKSQGARVRALNGFKEGDIQVLVATDIAARGLDINQLPAVINFDLPHVAEDYVHRIGRTGRAGAKGLAISMVSADEAKQLNDIEQLLQKQLKRKYVTGFEPDHEVPASKPIKPRKQSRPKKNKAAKKPENRKNDKKRTSNSKRRRSRRGGKKSIRPAND